MSSRNGNNSTNDAVYVNFSSNGDNGVYSTNVVQAQTTNASINTNKMTPKAEIPIKAENLSISNDFLKNILHTAKKGAADDLLTKNVNDLMSEMEKTCRELIKYERLCDEADTKVRSLEYEIKHKQDIIDKLLSSRVNYHTKLTELDYRKRSIVYLVNNPNSSSLSAVPYEIKPIITSVESGVATTSGSNSKRSASTLLTENGEHQQNNDLSKKKKIATNSTTTRTTAALKRKSIIESPPKTASSLQSTPPSASCGVKSSRPVIGLRRKTSHAVYKANVANVQAPAQTSSTPVITKKIKMKKTTTRLNDSSTVKIVPAPVRNRSDSESSRSTVGFEEADNDEPNEGENNNIQPNDENAGELSDSDVFGELCTVKQEKVDDQNESSNAKKSSSSSSSSTSTTAATSSSIKDIKPNISQLKAVATNESILPNEIDLSDFIKCDKCDSLFQNEKDYKKHIREAHLY